MKRCSLTKYTSAGQVLAEVLKKLVSQVTAGKNVLELCIESVLLSFGDELVAEVFAQRRQAHHGHSRSFMEQG